MPASDMIAAQLREVFGDRLKMVASFGADFHLCAIVDTLTMADLKRCAEFGARWKKNKSTPPLVITADELRRALDAFPLEFSEIIATRRLIAGDDVLGSLTVPTEDLRRACEVQARSHLLHLREGYIEAAANDKAIAALVAASKPPFHALISNIARLDGTTADELISRLGLIGSDFKELLKAAERLVAYVDGWKHR